MTYKIQGIYNVERKALKFELKKDDIAGRVFSGYASTFDVDLGGDIITPGAMKLSNLCEMVSSIGCLSVLVFQPVNLKCQTMD
jgi:Ran GTPase-activating protein (RanGAP) involved in mRNA processing and transport